MKRLRHTIAVASLLFATVGCSDAGYYLQSVRGHLAVMSARQPIAEVLEDGKIPPQLRVRLEKVQAMRRFAVEEMQLPDNDSFSTYADIGREAVVWSVVAAPVDSLTPVVWCFPFAGCVPYRGYFSRQEAVRFADGMRNEGYDVLVGEVPAYSTLGWFSDPVLNTFIDYPDWLLAEVLFHELAHQVVYVEDDADFNEAFAQTVMEEGGRRWLQAHGSDQARAQAELMRARQQAFSALVADTRAALLDCYGCETTRAEKLNCKQKTLAGMLQAYGQLREAWGGYSGYDAWFEHDFNNARFVSLATYTRWIPAFNRLLQEHDGDLARFYQAVDGLAGLPAAERRQRLEQLMAEDQ